MVAGPSPEKRELREAHLIFTEMGATGHAEQLARVATELEASPDGHP